MTDYLRPMAAYVASQSEHHQRNDHPGHPAPVRVSTPDIKPDTTHQDVVSGADRGWTR